jgi:nicotinamidase/pyrazinamidase
VIPNTVFWDVDTQHDFMDPDGKLPVPDARSILPNLEKLTRFAVERGIPIIASADAHPAGDPEFEEFGEHCVPGTHGQEKIAATCARESEVVRTGALDEQVRRLSGGQINQLVVEKKKLDVFTLALADELLYQLDPGRVYVYGVATEYCVFAEVRSLLERGYSVTVVADAIKPIDPQAGTDAVEEMRRLGASFATADAVIEELSS